MARTDRGNAHSLHTQSKGAEAAYIWKGTERKEKEKMKKKEIFVGVGGLLYTLHVIFDIAQKLGHTHPQMLALWACIYA